MSAATPNAPLPWAVRESIADRTYTHIYSDRFPNIACTRQVEDAAYIVHACNAYPKLIALVQEYSEEYGHGRFVTLLRELGEDA